MIELNPDELLTAAVEVIERHAPHCKLTISAIRSYLAHPSANARQPTEPQSGEERQQHKNCCFIERSGNSSGEQCILAEGHSGTCQFEEEPQQPKAITADRLLELLEAKQLGVDILPYTSGQWRVRTGDGFIYTGSSLFEALRQALGGDGVHLLPCHPDACQECGHNPPHEAYEPHDAQSLYYQYHFYSEHGRWPTWTDAIAHLSPEMQEFWKTALLEMGQTL